jgi:hypothetical protein
VRRGLAGLSGPEPHEGQDLRGLLALAQVGVAVAEDAGVGILGQEGQDALLPAAPAGDIVPVLMAFDMGFAMLARALTFNPEYMQLDSTRKLPTLAA